MASRKSLLPETLKKIEKKLYNVGPRVVVSVASLFSKKGDTNQGPVVGVSTHNGSNYMFFNSRDFLVIRLFDKDAFADFYASPLLVPMVELAIENCLTFIKKNFAKNDDGAWYRVNEDKKMTKRVSMISGENELSMTPILSRYHDSNDKIPGVKITYEGVGAFVTSQDLYCFRENLRKTDLNLMGLQMTSTAVAAYAMKLASAKTSRKELDYASVKNEIKSMSLIQIVKFCEEYDYEVWKDLTEENLFSFKKAITKIIKQNFYLEKIEKMNLDEFKEALVDMDIQITKKITEENLEKHKQRVINQLTGESIEAE
jgi:hypothetical protein